MLLFAGLIHAAALHAQSDKDNKCFAKAEEALSVKKCDVALQSLQIVSIDGKENPKYLKLMAEMHECKGNKEQAVYFYRKYMETHPSGADTTQLHISHLSSNIEQKGNSGRLHSAKTLLRKIYAYDLTFSAITGGKDGANFNRAIRISAMGGRCVMRNHALLEGTLLTGIATSPNNSWFITALGYDTGSKVDIAFGLIFGAKLALSPVWKNNSKYAIIAGPEIGYQSIIGLSRSTQASGPSYNDDNYSLGSLTAGLKVRYMYYKTFTACIEYERLLRTSVDVITLDPSGTTRTNSHAKVNMGLISVGVGVYLHSFFHNSSYYY